MAYLPQFFEVDLVDIAALQQACARRSGQSGPVSVLVNNAANDDRHDWREVTPEYFDDRINVNLRHYFFAIQALAPHGSLPEPVEHASPGLHQRPSLSLVGEVPRLASCRRRARLGRSNAQIASELLMGDEPVKSHLSRSYAKLGVREPHQVRRTERRGRSERDRHLQAVNVERPRTRSPQPKLVEPPLKPRLVRFTFPGYVATPAVVPGPGYLGVTRRHVMYVVTSSPSTCAVGVLKIASSPSKVTWRSTSVPIKFGSAAPCGVRMNVRRSLSTT